MPADGRQSLVQVGVEDATQQRAPAGARSAEDRHDEQGQRQVRGGQPGRRAADDEGVDDAAERGQCGGEAEGQKLEAVRRQAQHGDTALVVAQAGQHPTQRRAVDPVHHERRHGEEGQRQPVEVDRVGHADERARQMHAVHRQPLLAAGQAARVAVDEDGTDLGEGQRHHGEGNTGGTQGDRAQYGGEHGGGEYRDRRGRPQWPVRAGDEDVDAVRAGRDVERVPEGEQAGPPEQQVVPDGQAAEHQAQRQKLEGAGRVERPVEEPGNVHNGPRQRGGRREDRRRRQLPERGHVAALPAMPYGRTRSTTASSATTQTSPAPAVP